MYGPNYELRPWLEAFISNVGINRARALLAKENLPIVRHHKNGSICKCALLFFGISRQFADTAYPSTKENILDINRNCCIFVHAYDVKVANENNSSVPVDITELDLLRHHGATLTLDTEDTFQEQNDLDYFRQFFPLAAPGSWTYPTSMDNMIRQWHSIKSVWGLMTAHEAKHQTQFSRVGLFRLDVRYNGPVDISSGGVAVIPSMMHDTKFWSSQVNDRMFYGARDFAKVWAIDRFVSVAGYMNWQEVNLSNRVVGLHSESFLQYLLLEKWQLPLEEKDICFERVRASGDILGEDCDLIGKKNTGIIVLGMHRSGTSLLTGLLARGLSFALPGELVKSNSQNPLGFFENEDVVRQNDIWLKEQKM